MYRKWTVGKSCIALSVLIVTTLVLVPSAKAQSKFKTLHSFSGKVGDGPTGELIFDSSGNLYGTVYGADEGGTVFKLTPSRDGSWINSVLYNFCSLGSCADGAGPRAGLIFDKEGSLYSTTFAGGTFNNGTVFKLTPKRFGSWTETVLYSFTGESDGANPTARLIFDPAGNLYGTTSTGGTFNNGAVFKLTPQENGSWAESVLYSFTGESDGANPSSGLIFDQVGNLYGSAQGGGNRSGTIFRLTPNEGSWTESVLYTFCPQSPPCPGGGNPYGGLIFDTAGNLYGTNFSAGLGGGTVFMLTPNMDGGWTETVLHTFCSLPNCCDGERPLAGLIFDSAGNLYGTTYFGGNLSYCRGNGCGVVFKLAPRSNGGWEETVLHVFYDRPGAFPYASPTFDTAGNLYGTTSGDFVTTSGSVFEITP